MIVLPNASNATILAPAHFNTIFPAFNDVPVVVIHRRFAIVRIPVNAGPSLEVG